CRAFGSRCPPSRDKTNDNAAMRNQPMSVSWSELTYVCDPGVGQEIVTLSPALSVTVYVRAPDLPAIAQLYTSVLGLIGQGRTHCTADGRKRRELSTGRALGMTRPGGAGGG